MTNMQSILDILGKSYIQSIILIVTVLATVLIYFCQKWAERRDAARTIIIQMDIMNRRVDALARIIGNDVSHFNMDKFWESQDILEENEWNRYRYMFVKKLNYNEIVALNNYYYNIVLMAKQQQNIKEIILEVFKHRAKSTQSTNEEQSLGVPTLLLQTILGQYEKIVEARATVPFERLKKIARM